DAPPPKPELRVVATDFICSESGAKPGVFIIARNGSTEFELTVRYSLSGTANNGDDYESLPGKVKLAAGAETTEVVVRPIDDDSAESTESVTLALKEDVGYMVSAQHRSATVLILDNDQSAPVLVVA